MLTGEQLKERGQDIAEGRNVSSLDWVEVARSHAKTYARRSATAKLKGKEKHLTRRSKERRGEENFKGLWATRLIITR